MNNLELIKQQYDERKRKKETWYYTYYRLKSEYLHTIQIDFQTVTPLDNNNEGLVSFRGIIVKRNKLDGRYESFEEYWKYTTIALQKTPMDSIISYATKKGIDIWNCKYLEIELRYHSRKKKSYCTIYSLKEIPEINFGNVVRNDFRNSLGNQIGNAI